MKSREPEKVYRVGEITRLIRAVLEESFSNVWIEGELSNVRRPASGHCYLTLKDADAQISGVLFRGNQRGLTVQPKDGLLVRVQGDVTVYERGGQYQVVIRRLEAAGQGDLQARFEELKKRLQAEGLFAPERKRPLPLLPRHVGVVTSSSGAAIRDILNVLTRRFPNLHVLLAPTRVQGEGAAAEIAAAIDLLNAYGGLDVMIVGRGGGSLEDLWCFNEEVVVRAIARSAVPVISAVGHEIDFTISDFVADLRAPTPSAAAELVVGRKDRFEEALAESRRALVRALRECATRYRGRFAAAAASYVFREPSNLARQHAQRLDALTLRMEHCLRQGARGGRECLRDLGLRAAHSLRLGCGETHARLDELARRGRYAAESSCRSARQDIKRLQDQLRALSPLAVLERGYSISTGRDGTVLRGIDGVTLGDRIRTRLADGTLESVVDTVVPSPTTS